MKTYRYVLFRIYTNKQNKIIFNCDKNLDLNLWVF